MEYAYTYNYDYSPQLVGGILAFLGAWLFVLLLVSILVDTIQSLLLGINRFSFKVIQMSFLND